MNFQVNPFSIYYMIWTYIYFVAISLFIDDMNSSCNSENTTLTKIRKYILHNDHRRPLCRTKLTVSMSKKQCEETIMELDYYCQHPDEYKANIFFQGTILKVIIIWCVSNDLKIYSLVKNKRLKQFYRVCCNQYER